MRDETGALAALVALAQEMRLRALRTLLHAFPEGMPAGQLGAAIGCAPSTLTFHLRQLLEAGLVESRRQGVSVIYTARPAGLADLTDYLTEACCGGRPEVCRPRPGSRGGEAVPACPGPSETQAVSQAARAPAGPAGRSRA
ncbi:ArsR/SmtB family transcription factor [Methylobacterium tarhaniae]|uniref:ArsR/SmtB family transcription factor n=1 Tax=Methylobacterium tarhaniae TaxID=1187852 RepID=UPI003CFBD689